MQHEFAVASFADINGAQIAYDVQGEGNLLILVHAGIADRRMWGPQFDELSKHFKTVRFDLRGFGETIMPPGEFSNVGDVTGLMDHFESDDAILVACSYGGTISFDVAATHPERVKKLVAIGSSVSGNKPSEDIIAGWDKEEAFIDAGDLDAATEVNLEMWVDGPGRTPSDVDPNVRELVFKMQRLAFDHEFPDDAEPVGIEPPVMERLSDIHTPTLVMVGEHDYPSKVEHCEFLGQNLPNAKYELIRGGAHMVSMEQPDVVNEHILKFLT